MIKSFAEFRKKYLGKGYNFDGVYGLQCVDGFKIAMMELGGNTGSIGGDGWADNIWYNRHKYADVCDFIFDMNDLKDGDIVLWAHKKRKSNSPMPLSHIAFYSGGKMFGMNQGANRLFTEKQVSASVWKGAIGALRPRRWNEVLGPDIPYPGLSDGDLAYDIVFYGYFNLGYGEERKAKLGKRYESVQKIVDQLLNGDHKPQDDIIRPGDKVSVIKPVMYGTNKTFKTYYDIYDVISINANRVVIGVNGAITAAVNKNNLKKV